MGGAVPPLPQCAFMAWCSGGAQGKLYLYLRQNNVCKNVPLKHEVKLKWSSQPSDVAKMFVRIICSNTAFIYCQQHSSLCLQLRSVVCGRLEIKSFCTVGSQTYFVLVSKLSASVQSWTQTWFYNVGLNFLPPVVKWLEQVLWSSF